MPMKKLLSTIALVFIFFVNIGMTGINPGKIVVRSESLEPCNSANDHSIAKGARPSRIPKGAIPKPGSKVAPKGSHETNKRESNREKHEKADARRQKEQNRAEEKRNNDKKR